MKYLLVVVAGFCVTSCGVMKEDGVAQCERSIRSRLNDPSFYRRVTTDVGNINVDHPSDTHVFTERWVDIVYDAKSALGKPLRYRHHCAFSLDNGAVGTLVREEDRGTPQTSASKVGTRP